MRLAIAAAMLAACSSAPAEPATPAKKPPPAPTAEQICANGDPYACFEARRAECTADTRVWRFRETQVGVEREVVISDNGLLRELWAGEVRLASSNGNWIACVEGCTASGEPGCVPQPKETPPKPQPPDGCQVERAPGETWEGGPTEILELACDDPSRWMRITYATEQAALRAAMTRVGRYATTNWIPDTTGYPIRIEMHDRVRGTPTDVVRITSFGRASCDAFAYPEGATSYVEPHHVEHARQRLPALEQRTDEPLERAIEGAMREIAIRQQTQSQHAIVREVGRACLGERADYTMAEINKCMEQPAMKQLANDIRLRIAAEERKRLVDSMIDVRAALREEHVLRPLCRELSEL